MEANEILEVLNQWQGTLDCLGNDGRMHFADARLTVFRSPQHFAVFTEFSQYMYDAEVFTNAIGYAGNCLVEDIGGSEDFLFPVPVIEPVAEEPLWGEANDYRWVVDRERFCVSIAGKRFDFTPTREDYDLAQIVFDNDKRGPNSINPGQMLHFLCHHLDHPFFASQAQLRALIDPEIEPRMEILLQTSHWQHPVFLVDYPGAQDEFPDDVIRNIPGWQVLSRIIAAGDTSEWFAQDTTGFNTDWLSLERIRYEGGGELYDNTVYDF